MIQESQQPNGFNPFSHLVRPDLQGRFSEAKMILEQRDRLGAIRRGKVVPPYEVIFHPSGVCNLGCEWCIGARILDGGLKDHKKDLLPSNLTNPDTMERVIRDMAAYERDSFRIENFSFSGITGEPLVAKRAFMRAVEILKGREGGARVGIFSNSTLIDADLIDTLLKIDYINVSLDAATPDTFAKLKCGGKERGRQLFERLIDNIRRLVAARNADPNSKLAINASVILHPDNYHEIYQVAALLKSLGVDILRMKQDISGGRLLSAEQKAEASELIRETQKLVGDGFKFVQIHPLDNPPVLTRTFDKCRVTDLWGAVGSDGSVFPCNYNALVGVVPYGNVISDSFANIWEGPKRMAMKEKLPEGCPAMCDPFKTRANQMLEVAAGSINLYGESATYKLINDLVIGNGE